MAVIKNSVDLPVAYNLKTPNPLDGRTVVDTKTDLIDNTKWIASAEFYVGLPVYVKDTNEFYILNKKDDEVTIDLSSASETQKNAAYSKWTKIATFDSLAQAVKDLGPVFKFKGIATAIDPDHTTLTIGSGSIDITVGETTTSEKLISYGTVLQENLDNVKYAWGTSEQPNLFFTDYLYTTNNTDQTQYKKGSEMQLQYINVFDTLYFSNGIQQVSVSGSSTAEVRAYTVWKALDDGGTLYSLPNGNTLDIYTVTSSSLTLPDPLVTEITSTTYKYYEFISLITKYVVTINSQMESITASSENNGHVYQIGEEEYASNGNMWVQLGSPKTDWIVL